GAVSLLERECSRREVECMRIWILLGLKANSPVEVATKNYLALECSDLAVCASAHRWLADVLRKDGRVAQALHHYVEFARISSSAEAWLQVAALAEQQGRQVIARQAHEEASRLEEKNRHPSGAD